jgi:putative transferase (TIGR04331 family)
LKTFLALTALEDFWDTTQPLLFLGEWCKDYQRNTRQLPLDAEILTFPAPETCYSEEDYEYSLRIYEHLLHELANWLNCVHGTEYSVRYWRVVIGPFLLWYIQVVHHRYACLKQAYSLYPDLHTIGLAEHSYLTPINTREYYMWASESHGWNLQLLTQLLHLAFIPPSQHRDYNWEMEKKQRQNAFGKPLIYKWQTKLKLHFLRLIAKLGGNKVTGLCVFTHEFSRTNLLRLIFSSKLRILPLTPMVGDEPNILRENKLNTVLRDRLAQLPAQDDFARLVLQTLKINMPLNFIENYKAEAEQSEKCYPYRPGVIVNTGWMQHDLLKLWGAKLAERGTKLINVQHGGGYGMHLFFTSEWLERKNCQRFISWGWQDGVDVIPAPSILMCERERESKNKTSLLPEKNLLLWVTTDAVTYPPFIGSYLSYMQQSYYSWQQRFADALTKQVFAEVTMRIRPNSPYYVHVRELFPGLKIHLPHERASYFDQLPAAKIIISDNCHTTFLYGLAFNIPTLLFWDPKLWQQRAVAQPYFQALQRVGIYHDTPESAAVMLNKIAQDPLPWWQSAEVQQARKIFCEHYIRVSPQWLQEWRDLLLKLNGRCLAKASGNNVAADYCQQILKKD